MDAGIDTHELLIGDVSILAEVVPTHDASDGKFPLFDQIYNFLYSPFMYGTGTSKLLAASTL